MIERHVEDCFSVKPRKEILGQRNTANVLCLSILFPKQSFQFTFPSTMYMNDGIYLTFVNTTTLFLFGGGGDVYLVVIFAI